MNQARAGVHSFIDNPKELAQKIVAVLDDPKKAKDRKIEGLMGWMDEKQMGENGRRYFLERFESKTVTWE